MGLHISVIQVSDNARAADEATMAVDAHVSQIVKSLVFLASGEPVLALVSGSNRPDSAKLAPVAGGVIERADADAVRAATGFAIGGVSPVGHSLPVVCDRDLLEHDVVWAAAGTPHHVFPIAPADPVRITNATVAEIAEL